MEMAGILSSSARNRTLRAMSELCAEQGYEETTIEQVVARAGLPAESFASLFESKEACAAAAVNAILGEVMAVVSAAYSSDRSEWDSVLLGIKAILELMAAYPSFAHLAYIGSRQMCPARAREIYLAGVDVLTAALDRLWEYSEGDAQPPCASRGAFGAAEAVVRREITAGRAGELPRLLPDVIYGATVPFLGQEEALRLTRRARELLGGAAWAEPR
jgi:AcrR family transcriptional regulator